jgi:1,4-alpha-glucan branching enzyme
MNLQQNGTGSALRRFSAKRVSKPVNFVCQAPGAKQVSLIGDFNEWQPDKHVMKKQADGAWMVQVSLCHGHHQYLFWVDGEVQLDPRAQGIARIEGGQRVSLVAIS